QRALQSLFFVGFLLTIASAPAQSGSQQKSDKKERLPVRHQTKMSTSTEMTSALHIHSPCLERSSLCVPEKFEDSGNKLLGTFNMWHMAATIDDAKLGTRDLLMKSLGKIERDEFIFA